MSFLIFSSSCSIFLQARCLRNDHETHGKGSKPRKNRRKTGKTWKKSIEMVQKPPKNHAQSHSAGPLLMLRSTPRTSPRSFRCQSRTISFADSCCASAVWPLPKRLMPNGMAPKPQGLTSKCLRRVIRKLGPSNQASSQRRPRQAAFKTF